MTKDKIIEDWENEFDELTCRGHFMNFYTHPHTAHIKSFIRQLLSLQKQEIVEEIEKMKYLIPVSKGIPIIEYQREMKGYKRAVDEIIKRLNQTLTP